MVSNGNNFQFSSVLQIEWKLILEQALFVIRFYCVFIYQGYQRVSTNNLKIKTFIKYAKRLLFTVFDAWFWFDFNRSLFNNHPESCVNNLFFAYVHSLAPPKSFPLIIYTHTHTHQFSSYFVFVQLIYTRTTQSICS